MAGGMTYHELMLGNAVMRANATAGTDDNESLQLRAIEQDWRRRQGPTYEEEQMARIRYDAERAAAAQRVREEAERAARALAQPRPPEREAVICTPSRCGAEYDFASTWREKKELRARLEGDWFLRKEAPQVAYEWGYIRALRDMGQADEADRLERKMRRGSIFRVEKGKAAAEVKELETLYERETP